MFGDSRVRRLIADLDAWLREHRADFYPKLNPPATPEQLSQLELELGMKLPRSLRVFLQWKNGQPVNVFATFHPMTNEMFMSSESMISAMREMKELARRGDIAANTWSNTWLPFMDSGGGVSCLDVDTGAVVYREHETQEPIKANESFEQWLSQLVRELTTNNFSAWDFSEVRGGS